MRWQPERELETRQARADVLLVLGLALGLAVGAPAAADEDCEPVVTAVKTFTATAGALRNTSTDGVETDGSEKIKRIVAVVELECPPSEIREVDVGLMPMNNMNPDNEEEGSAWPLVLGQSLVSKLLSGRERARFEFAVFYNSESCEDREGPIPKDQGGVNQVNEGAFTFTASASSDDNGGFDPGPNQGSGASTVDLICKPSRTTAS